MSPRPDAVKRWLLRAFLLAPVMAMLLAAATLCSMQPPAVSWRAAARETGVPRVTDRSGQPLTASCHTRWNTADRRALHDMPPLLVAAFLQSEDKRFYMHRGIDWRARGSALLQNLRAASAVRGASTITEQVIRLLHPRPRTLWSKWV